MINIIWFILIGIGILIAAGTGKTDIISTSIFVSAGKAIEFSIGLAGIMAFWSGILKIAEVSGMTEALARLFQPIFAKLFPKIPKNHPALGLISLTVSANFLGLGNVATPIGLKTMAELKALSPDPDQASDATCTFMALVFGSLSLIPSTVIAIRAQAGSNNPALVIVPVFIISLAGTLIGLLVNYIAIRLTRK
jgi:spore maturation protein A